MPAEIVTFPGTLSIRPPLAQFIRLGEYGYKKLESLQSAGQLPATRVVVDASRFHHQRELIAAFRASGAELVLDTKAAELAAPAKFGGYAKGAPWAGLADGRPLGPEIYSGGHSGDIFGAIARFAVEHRFDAVLAPSHFIGDPQFDRWLDTDRRSCALLRQALDREGGGHIAIDYLLIARHTMLNDDDERNAILQRISDAPFDSLWVRASGFGQDAAPLAIRRYIASLSGLHNLGKPIVADYLGGLVGRAALAFGAISGIAHGIGEHERFDAGNWHKAPKRREDGGGRTTRIALPVVGKSLTVPELELLAIARGGRRLVVCNDRSCCPHGLPDMISDPRRHAARQSMRRIDELSRIPELNREAHFVNGELAEADRLARQMKSLKPAGRDAERLRVDPDNLMRRIAEHSKKIDKTRSTLEDLHEQRGDSAHRARPVPLRGTDNRQGSRSGEGET